MLLNKYVTINLNSEKKTRLDEMVSCDMLVVDKIKGYRLLLHLVRYSSFIRDLVTYLWGKLIHIYYPIKENHTSIRSRWKVNSSFTWMNVLNPGTLICTGKSFILFEIQLSWIAHYNMTVYEITKYMITVIDYFIQYKKVSM